MSETSNTTYEIGMKVKGSGEDMIIAYCGENKPELKSSDIDKYLGGGGYINGIGRIGPNNDVPVFRVYFDYHFPVLHLWEKFNVEQPWEKNGKFNPYIKIENDTTVQLGQEIWFSCLFVKKVGENGYISEFALKR